MLEARISQAELEKALPKLANGKAAGRARLACLAVAVLCVLSGGREWPHGKTLNPGAPPDRSPECFFHPWQHPSMRQLSAGPPHPQEGLFFGPTTAMGIMQLRHLAGSMPIAVGEPLNWLYTIILNACLLSQWTEEHGLRSPAKAGFRPSKPCGVHNTSLVCPAALHCSRVARLAALVYFNLYTSKGFVDLQKLIGPMRPKQVSPAWTFFGPACATLGSTSACSQVFSLSMLAARSP